jgi:N utilization substance protein B
MINRRLLRIKVFKVLYSYVYSGNSDASAAQNDLLKSCGMTPMLYCYTLNSILAVKQMQGKKCDPKFLRNRFICMLEQNAPFQEFCRKNGLVWTEEIMPALPEKGKKAAKNVTAAEAGRMMKSALTDFKAPEKTYIEGLNGFISHKKQEADDDSMDLPTRILASPYYRDYIASGEDSLKEDCAFISNVIENEYEDNDLFEDAVNDMGFYPDEIGYVLNVILKDLNSFANGGKFSVPEPFVSKADKDFATGLLASAFKNYEDYADLIQANADKWDSDRIVSTDLILIVLGIAEAVAFSDIPVKVTINEYVDISKFYSTQNSRIFVNGLLDKIIQQKINSGEIKKTKE